MQQLTTIKTKHCEIWIDAEEILILKVDDNIEMSLEEVTACFETYAKLGVGKENKVLQLILAGDESTMPHDARQFVAEKGKDFFIASALVGQSLAVRLIVNFYNTFYKHQVPFKMFGDETAARGWLGTFK